MALSTLQLNQILTQEPSIRRYFIGTFPSCLVNPKCLPRRRQFCFVTNTENHESSGEHWNAFFVRDKTLYFFDSFGRSPSDETLPHSYRDILLKFDNVKYLNKQIQPFDSFTCGYYCVHMLLVFSMGLDFSNFMEEYNVLKKQENDFHVLNVIDSII